jgi:hypothetical protein
MSNAGIQRLAKLQPKLKIEALSRQSLEWWFVDALLGPKRRTS